MLVSVPNNRTTLELKLCTTTPPNSFTFTNNRTTLELKR